MSSFMKLDLLAPLSDFVGIVVNRPYTCFDRIKSLSRRCFAASKKLLKLLNILFNTHNPERRISHKALLPLRS